MDTSVPNTASQLLIMGREALDYVRTCSADPGRLAAIFASDSSFDDSRNEVTLPPIHEIFPDDENSERSDEFVERLRRLGFQVHCSFDATYIRWRSMVSFPNARMAADQTADALHPLVDECIRDVKFRIETAISEHKFETIVRSIRKYDEAVQTEVIIFLKNSGYEVKEHREWVGDSEYGGRENVGYKVSWHPRKVIRDMTVVPWWTRLWRKVND